MTREEKGLIIYCLKANSDFHREVCEECKNYPKCDHFHADSLMEKLIKALEQGECDDAVSRQAVMDEINEWIKSGEYGYTNATYYLSNRINNLQSGNPSKTGHWIIEKWNNKEHYSCSNCQHVVDYEPCYHYCPYCGAKMVEPQESEVNK